MRSDARGGVDPMRPRVSKDRHRGRDLLGPAAFNPCFRYAGLPLADAEASLRLFASEVLPVLRSWESEPLAKPAARSTPL